MCTVLARLNVFLLLAIPLVVWLVKRTQLASWWDPRSWWKDSTKLAGEALDHLKSWVLSVVQNAVNLVENDVTDVFNWATTLYNDLSAAVSYGEAVLQGAINGVRSWAGGAIGFVARTAQALASDARAYAEYLFRSVTGAAQWLASDLRRWAVSAIRFVEQEALQWARDVQRWALAALNAVEGALKVALKDSVNWLVGVIRAAMGDIYRLVIANLIKPIEDVLHYVRLAWDWVIWFAEHPFKVVHDVENDVINWGDHLPHDIEQVVKGRAFHEGMDAMGKFLGG